MVLRHRNIQLITDLVFGKYSLLIFNREIPYILVRNFLCVGIPYFCIGSALRETRWNLDKNVFILLIPLFVVTGMVERFLLTSAGMNAARDHYISTTLLAICLFMYVLESNWKNEKIAMIGRKYSTWLYIVHPIVLAVFSFIINKIGLYSVYRFVAPIVVYFATLAFLVVIERMKKWCFHIEL